MALIESDIHPMIERADLFRCPRTGAPLTFRGEQFVSSDGSVSYPVEDGIIDFRCSRKDYYFNPVPRGPMAALTAEARHAPWWKPVRSFLGHVKGSWLDNLVVDGRYAWKLLLDLNPDAQILDLGCGLGNLTSNLAPHVARAFAMDLTIERLRFAKQRFASFNRGDDIILVAGGDGARLPFPDPSLDLVALSGVLEWVGDDEKFRDTKGSKLAKALKMSLSFFGERNPRAVQQRFLKEIRRVLKPSGQLFIGIENRLSHEYFYRRVDHHSGLRFASVMPRLIANLYSIAVAHRPYRTYTYSLPGYRRLLRRTGFTSQRFYGLTPGYSQLSEILPLDTKETFWTPPARTGWEQITHNKYLVPAFGVIGTSSTTPSTSLLARTLTAIEHSIPTRGPLSVVSFSLTDKDRGRIEARDDETPYIITLPFNRSSLDALVRHREALEALQGCPGLQRFIPKPPLQGMLQGVHYFVEERLAGSPAVDHLRAGRRDQAAAGVIEVLDALNPRSSRVLAPFAGDFYRAEVEEPLERIASVLDAPGLLAPLAEFFRKGLLGRDMPRGVTHGELTVSNVVVSNGRVSGLVGWDYARLSGLPILDALAYLESVDRALAPGEEHERIERLAGECWPDLAEWSLLQEQYDAFGVDRGPHRELVYLQWVHSVRRRLDGYFVYDPAAIQRQVIAVLKRFETTTQGPGAGRG